MGTAPTDSTAATEWLRKHSRPSWSPVTRTALSHRRAGHSYPASIIATSHAVLDSPYVREHHQVVAVALVHVDVGVADANAQLLDTDVLHGAALEAGDTALLGPLPDRLPATEADTDQVGSGRVRSGALSHQSRLQLTSE